MPDKNWWQCPFIILEVDSSNGHFMFGREISASQWSIDGRTITGNKEHTCRVVAFAYGYVTLCNQFGLYRRLFYLWLYSIKLLLTKKAIAMFDMWWPYGIVTHVLFTQMLAEFMLDGITGIPAPTIWIHMMVPLTAVNRSRGQISWLRNWSLVAFVVSCGYLLRSFGSSPAWSLFWVTFFQKPMAMVQY